MQNLLCTQKAARKKRQAATKRQIDNLFDYAAIGEQFKFMELLSASIRYRVLNLNNLLDSNGHTYLHYATANGHLEIVQFIINSAKYNKAAFKFNINAVNILNETALLLAVKSNYSEVAKYLLNNGADVSIQDKWGLSCLDYAKYNGNQQLINLLLDKNKVDISGSNSSTKKIEQIF